MDTLNLKNSWEWRGLKKRVLFLNVPGALLSVWLSVGQTLNSSNSVSSGCKEPARGSLGWASIFQRGKGALAETLLCKAKTGMLLSFGRKNIFWTFLTLRTVSQVVQKSSNRPLCHVCRTNDYPAERWGFYFSWCLISWENFGETVDWALWAWSANYRVSELLQYMCAHASETYVSVGTNPCPYQVYIIFPSVIMTSHFEDPCVLSIEERRQAASPVWQGYHHFSPTPEGLCKWFLLCSLSLPDSVGNGRLPSPCDVSSY